MKTNLKFRLLFTFFVFFSCSLFFLVNKIFSADSLTEDFNTLSLDTTNKWTLLNELNVNTFSGTSFLLSQVDSKRSVFLQNKEPQDTTQGITYEIRFKFNTLGFGSGIAVNDMPTPLRTLNHPDSDDWTVFLWPTSTSSFKIFSVACPEIGACLPTDNPLFIVSGPDALNWHTMEIKYSSGIYEIKLDNLPVIKTKHTSREPKYVWLGNPMISGGTGFSSFEVDYLRVSEIAPNFPYLSQKDPLWASKEYDSATSWTGIDKNGINRWGCALTSVAMVLQNYNVKTTSGEAVTPDNLNTWLKSQPDGYVGPGLLNWLAVTRFAKQSFDIGNAPKKLEYVRSYLPTAPILPAILSTGSHFVVAHAEDTTNWNINDPANVDTKMLTKTTSIKSINRFVQSETDLSYMMFVLSASDSATLKEASNNPIDITWVEESISDDVDIATPAAMKVGMLAKPSTGNYLLTVNRPGPGSSEAKVYLYDLTANPVLQTITLDKQVTNIGINYSKELSTDTVITEVDLTPPLTPTIIAPSNGADVKPAGLILDWSDATDPSSPVTYKYKSTWVGGSYGPVSTGTLSQIDASGTADGEYVWQIQACDSVANCSDWSSPNKVFIDSTAPSSDIVFPAPGTSSNYFEVVYSELVDPIEATDGANYYLSNWPGAGGSGDLVGDANISYNPTSKTSRVVFTSDDWYISPEQLWGIQNIHDLAGNVLAVNPYVEYSTPMTPPTINIPVTTPNPTNSLMQTWSWLAGSDIGSGIKGYSTKTYDVVGQKYLSDWLWIGQVLGTSTTLGEGAWQLSLQATDNAGNISESKSSEILTIDTTSPSIPTNLHFVNPDLNCGGFTNSKNITFDWDDATDNNKLSGYEYNVDYPLGSNRGSWTTFFTTSSYRGSLNEGIHYLKLRSKDSAGNYSAWSNSCAITYDSIIPKLSSKTTYDGWYNKSQTSEFSFDDTNLVPSYVKPICEIGSEGLNQTCQVTPNICDKAGNCYTNTLTSNPADIDLTKPVVNLSAWGSTIDGTATDILSGVDKVEIRIRKPDSNEITVLATGATNWTYTMTDPVMGNYKIVVLAYDKAGNLNDEVSKEFVMSPASQDNARVGNQNNATVLGVTTTSSKSIKRIVPPEPIVETIIDEVKQQDTTPESSDNGNVLGEADALPPKSNRYLWIFAGCSLGLLILLWFIFRAKRK